MTTGLSHVAYRDQGARHGNDFFGTPTLPCGFETDCDPAPHRTTASRNPHANERDQARK